MEAPLNVVEPSNLSESTENLSRFYAAANTAGFGANLPVNYHIPHQQSVSSYVRNVASPRDEAAASLTSLRSSGAVTNEMPVKTVVTTAGAQQAAGVPCNGGSNDTLFLFSPDDASLLPQNTAAPTRGGWNPPPSPMAAASLAFATHPSALQTMAPGVGMEAYYAAMMQQQQLSAGLMPFMGYTPPAGCVAYPASMLAQEVAEIEQTVPSEAAAQPVLVPRRQKRVWCPCNTIFDT